MKKYPIVRRKFGSIKRKFDIELHHLPLKQQELLIHNKFIKRFSDDDQYIQALFWIVDMESQHKNLRTWWPNPYTGEITKYKDILDHSKTVKWPCAICGTTLQIKMDDYSWKSFCCSSCLKELPKSPRKIDDKIVNSTLAFTKHCKNLLQKRQKEFIKLAKRSAKD